MSARRTIGGSGLEVFPIGLGGMPLSIAGRPDEQRAYETIKAFVDTGGDFIDTANVYCLDDRDLGHNERLIGKALDRLGRRKEVLVATKGGLRRPNGAWVTDGDPKWLRQSCEQSLRDLGVECIALYQLHAIDHRVGLSDSLGELLRLQLEGKIRHIGLSNIGSRDLEAALGMTAIVSVQNRCNVLERRDFDSGLVRLCAERGVAFIPHSPVGGHQGHRRLAGNAAIAALARKHEASVYQIALAWLLHQGAHVIPIPGASKPASALASVKAAQIRLSAEEVAGLG